MALEKITEQQMDAQGVIAAPDILNGTPAQNKAIFDRMVRQLIAPAHNACVDAVNKITEESENWTEQEAQRAVSEEERRSAEIRREEAEELRREAEEERDAAEEQRKAVSETVIRDARIQATQAKSWAVGGTGERAGEDTDNAKYWAQQAQQAVGGNFATKTEVEEGNAETLKAAKKYTDEQISKIPTPDVSGQIAEHNSAEDAHAALFADKAPAYTYGTTDLTAGTSELAEGKLYFVYE